MKILFQISALKALVICFGYDTQLFNSMYWFTVETVYYDHELPYEYVTFAKLHIAWFKHPKYW